MANALFSFADRDMARSAADRVVAAGLPTDAVVFHVRDDTPADAHTGVVDELVTGGLLTNLEHLFQGVFAEHAPSDDVATHDDTLKLGEAVVSVKAQTPAEESSVDAIMKDAGCARRTSWGATPRNIEESQASAD